MRLAIRLQKARHTEDSSQLGLFGGFQQTSRLTPTKVIVNRAGAVSHLKTVWKRADDTGGRPRKPDPALAPETVVAIARGEQKRAERDQENRDKWHAENPLDTSKLADWTKLDGHDVLRVPGGRYAAVPVTGRKDARTFVVFGVDSREEIVQLRRDEVYRWLRDAERVAAEEGL